MRKADWGLISKGVGGYLCLSKIKLIYGDHRGDSRTALNEFTKLVSQEKVSAVISNRGHIGAVLDPISARKGVPLLGIMGHADFIERNPYGFRVWVSPTRDGGALADIAFKQGFRRAAMLVLQDDYIVTVASEFKNLSPKFVAKSNPEVTPLQKQNPKKLP